MLPLEDQERYAQAFRRLRYLKTAAASLTDKIEGAVNTIGGIDELRSTSSEGVSLVIVSFTLDKDIDVAVQEVRDHVTTVLPQLPKGIDPPIVSKLDPDAAPIMTISLSSSHPIREITE